jgi:hypothetical protein
MSTNLERRLRLLEQRIRVPALPMSEVKPALLRRYARLLRKVGFELQSPQTLAGDTPQQVEADRAIISRFNEAHRMPFVPPEEVERMRRVIVERYATRPAKA